MQVTATIVKELAPNGALRAAINLGNPVLAQAASDGPLAGVTVDLARDLAARLGVEIEFTVYPSAGEVVRRVASDRWDIAFLANEPERVTNISFTAPYALLEGTYLTADPQLHCVADADRDGVTIAVGDGAAYHLALKRLLTKATLITAPTSAVAIDLFYAGGITAVAGVRPVLVNAIANSGSGRVLCDNFSAIEQTIGMPHGRSAEALAFINHYCAARKKDGFIKAALSKSGFGATTIIS